jgi:hypothetical protein
LNQPLPSTIRFSQRPLTDRPFPYWDRIRSRDTGANATYNSMQTELSHRMYSGVTFDSAWTWAKNLSDANGPTSSGFSSETGGGRVADNFDRRRAGTAGSRTRAATGPVRSLCGWSFDR